MKIKQFIKKIAIKLGILPNYKVKDAILILKPIPEEDFYEGNFQNGDKYCAIAYINKAVGDNIRNVQCNLAGYLVNSSEEYIFQKHNRSKNIMNVNDSRDINGYTEPTAKQRVMHLLEEMEKEGY